MSSREVIEAAAERSRVTWHDRVARLRRLAPTLLMGAVAAGAAWLIAKELFGQTGAFFAPVAAIITLGLTVGSRLNRAIELSIGVPLGIALADVLVLEVGSGVPQLIGIVFLATAVAVFLGGGPLLVTQAAVSAILVVTLQPPTNGLSFTRAADALIGCGVALLLNFIVAPIDAMALVRREAAPVLRELAEVLDDIARALADRDRDRAV
ncbi:MAG: aromatic acid exporter family protein, partial [Conexibacter sp.]|nr:aromatic acid exporter family protein [Conexibacter sp.]